MKIDQVVNIRFSLPNEKKLKLILIIKLAIFIALEFDIVETEENENGAVIKSF